MADETDLVQCPQCNSKRASLSENSLICLDCNYRLSVPDYDKLEMQIKLAYLEDQLAVLDIKPPTTLSRTLKQTQAKMNYLMKKLNEHLDKSKKYEKYILKE